MNSTIICSVKSVTEAYEIEIQKGALQQQAKYLSTLASRFAIIADENTAHLYGRQLLKALKKDGLEAELFSFLVAKNIKPHRLKNS